MHTLKLTDGRHILVVDRSGLSDLIRGREGASVVLANADEPFTETFVAQLATLRDFGCRRFLCSGALSERLHDALDDRLHIAEDAEVMTTFHDENEPLDDVIALFLELGADLHPRSQIYVHGRSAVNDGILIRLKAASVA